MFGYTQESFIDLEEEFSPDYTEQEIDMLLSKYDIDLTEEDEESEEFTPMLQRHNK